jgi:hypothetical protein
MNATQNRLNLVLERIENKRFMKSDGLGNEIGFWIFDYPAADELLVREHLLQLEQKLTQRGYNFLNINVFSIILEMLNERKLLERAFKREKEVGFESLKKTLSGTLNQKNISAYIANKFDLESLDFVLMSGLGSAWPLVRGHELLSAMQDIMGSTPLVLFYPGKYSGQNLHPFGLVESKNYYRAFKLVPEQG